MVKVLRYLLTLFSISPIVASAESRDFGRSTSKEEKISPAELRERFELHGNVFVIDPKGPLLYQGNESRLWKFGNSPDIVSNWLFQSRGIKDIAIKHVWSIMEDGRIVAHIQQFESMIEKGKGREVEPGKLIREEKIEVKDFAPITWIAHSDPKQKVVVRLTPELSNKMDFVEIEKLPLTLGNPVLFDNKGRVWAQARSLEGRYIALKTHLGEVSLSYAPFKGAKEIGYVEGNEIVVNADKDLKLYLRSDAPILASTQPARVFGIVDLNKKSERINSLNTSSSSDEKSFLDRQ